MVVLGGGLLLMSEVPLLSVCFLGNEKYHTINSRSTHQLLPAGSVGNGIAQGGRSRRGLLFQGPHLLVAEVQ